MTATVFTSQDWNAWIAHLPASHLLQTWQWGQVKAKYGWKPLGILWVQTGPGQWQYTVGEFEPTSSRIDSTVNRNPIINGYTQPTNSSLPQGPVQAAALVLQRSLTIGPLSTRLKVTYLPKGPLLDWQNHPLRQAVLQDLQAYAHQTGAIFIKIDPDICLGTGVPGRPGSQEDPLGQQVTTELLADGWQYSQEQIQFRNTVIIDLTLNEGQLLAQMKQKTRYNIRLAERKGVAIRVGKPEDWESLYRMYARTSLRDGFVIRDETYYRTVWETFSQDRPTAGSEQPAIESLIAEVDNEPVAAVIIYRFAGKAWYLSGMSTVAHREKMPNYLLQWEAIRRAKAAGCTVYDLWGAPEVFTEQDSMWGVYRFKEGLGGEVLRTLGAWDYPARTALYTGYTQILPRVLDMMRRRGQARTKQSMLGS